MVKSEIDLADSVDHYDKIVYEKARDNYEALKKQGVLFQDEKPLLYIYAQTMDARVQYGIVGCAAV